MGNAHPSETAHLWDEVVGHLVWYAGFALVVVALARTMSGRPRPSPVGYVLAALVGLTWASNAVGGETIPFSLLLATLSTAYGWQHRHQLLVVLGVAGTTAVVVLVGATAVSVI